jgi:hypothetical protein
MNRPIPLRPDPSAVRNAAAQTLTRAVIANARAELFEPDRNATRVARSMWPDDKTTVELLTRATSTVATTTDSTWAGPLATYRVEDVLQNLGPLSVGSTLLKRGISLTFGAEAEIRVPGITVSAGAAGFVGQGAPIPVRQLAVSAGAVLQPRKFATIVPLTREMITSSNAEALVRAVLTDAVAASLDAALFSTTAGDTTRPPGLLYNVTPVTAATGGGQGALWSDLTALASAVAPYGGLDIAFVTDPGTAVKLTFGMGSQFKLPVLASSGVTAKTVIAVALPALCSATDPVPRLEASRDAVFHFEDTSPQPITGGTPSPAVPVRSMFQVDSVSIRLTMFVSWALRATGGIAYVPLVTW